ncbi:DUF6382 domain-containing protein ['Paenibacillus yunnanensis' Narsing Rao et al. 2020]|uniref:DUF6382 domain-containing protein n=1 Tax=Paenibacillus tengchongensis TaxID=2608684 RepID=UPI00124E460C|nr:DUF6382 domain-containing protein [Paenibacillus tengchongensis]
MFGLSSDFIQQDGITMLLGRQGGLSRGEIHPVQASMLMNSDIPNHLRLQLREIDLQITLEYTVGRRRMLSHLLVGEKFTMMDFFGLLLQIAVAMEEGRLYMLRTEQYALHEDYIFVEGPLKGGEIYLTCIPMEPDSSAPSAGGRLKSLIMVLMPAVTELAGSGVQKLLRYCSAEDFTPSGLKRMLSELLTVEVLPDPSRDASSGDTEMAWPYSVNYEDKPANGAPQLSKDMYLDVETLVKGQTRREHASPELPLSGSVPWEEDYPKLRLRAETPLGDEMVLQAAEPVQLAAYRVYVLLGSIVLGALAWKLLYLSDPSNARMGICALLTLLLATITFVVWTGKIVIGGKPAGSAEVPEEAAAGRERGLQGGRELAWDFGRHPVATGPAQAPQKPEQEVPRQLFKDNRQNESIRKDSIAPPGPLSTPAHAGATVLLSRQGPVEGEHKAGQRSRAAPYLERVQDGEEGPGEMIELNHSSFIIGRSPEVAQYVEKSEGASRVHAEISRGPEGYVLKDLDSRNGTLFQGEAMVPYKEYLLHDGTVFSIVKGRYTFRSA